MFLKHLCEAKFVQNSSLLKIIYETFLVVIVVVICWQSTTKLISKHVNTFVYKIKTTKILVINF